MPGRRRGHRPGGGVLQVGMAAAKGAWHREHQVDRWPPTAVPPAALVADRGQVAVGAGRAGDVEERVIVPEQLELVRQVVDGRRALVAVGRPLGLVVEPALRVRRVRLQHVAPVARRLRAVPRGVQPGEEAVVARALVLRVLDD